MNQTLHSQYGPWALIAGGSEGIGLAFARQLAKAGINLILLARRDGPLQAAREQLLEKFDIDVRVHSLDLTAPGLEHTLAQITKDLEIGLLIYNAGAVHGAARFHDEPLDKALQLIALNCTGPATFAHHLGGRMRDRGHGGIILLSSVSGLSGGAYIATYCATKAFDIAFAEGLWAELTPHGVNVLGLIAGATDTPAMADSGIAFEPGQAMDPADVAREGLEQLSHGPIHVAGAGNRDSAGLMRDANRRMTVGFMSMGAATMYGKNVPELPQ